MHTKTHGKDAFYVLKKCVKSQITKARNVSPAGGIPSTGTDREAKWQPTGSVYNALRSLTHAISTCTLCMRHISKHAMPRSLRQMQDHNGTIYAYQKSNASVSAICFHYNGSSACQGTLTHIKNASNSQDDVR